MQHSSIFHILQFTLLNNWLKYYAPVICNHRPPEPPPHPTYGEYRGQQLFIHNSPALRGLAESHSPVLYKSKFHWGCICVISQAWHLPGTAGELKRSLPSTLAPLSPAHPRRWVGGRGQGLQMTGALCSALP